MSTNHSITNKHRRGATMMLFLMMLVVLLGMVAFAVDVGRMYLARNQLQTAVDAGALAASLQLAKDRDDVEARDRRRQGLCTT